jgi:hypothetical protein
MELGLELLPQAVKIAQRKIDRASAVATTLRKQRGWILFAQALLVGRTGRQGYPQRDLTLWWYQVMKLRRQLVIGLPMDISCDSMPVKANTWRM